MKKILCVVLTLCLLCAMTTAVFADIWIPENYQNDDLLALPEKDGDCYALNAFLTYCVETNFVGETGEFDEQVPWERYYTFALKHFELNPELYPNEVTGYTDRDGTVCMEISENLIKETTKHFFQKPILAENYPGYTDGKVVVAAENFGMKKQVFASAVSCRILYNNLYFVEFEVFSAEDAAEYLSTANQHLPRSELNFLSNAWCAIRFDGEKKQTAFSVNDFSVDGYLTFETPIQLPYQNENAPFPSDQLAQMTVLQLPRPSSKSKEPLLLIAACVAIIVVAALGAILLMNQKKRKG